MPFDEAMRRAVHVPPMPPKRKAKEEKNKQSYLGVTRSGVMDGWAVCLLSK
jgi:hypothetical protein